MKWIKLATPYLTMIGVVKRLREQAGCDSSSVVETLPALDCKFHESCLSVSLYFPEI